MDKTLHSSRPYLIALLLAVLTVVVYWKVSRHEFITYDDQEYVVENNHVQQGFTRQNIRWAFTTGHAGNWHPLTWLSHMLDCRWYGLNPRGHHLSNLFFHAANTVLLFWVFFCMSEALWASAFVAAVFALHPLHVESVAWVAERKDVLSGFFFFLMLWAYAAYARRGGVWRYLLVFGALALGLMSKPMLVTAPFVLLLLDYWPLDRLVWGKRMVPLKGKATARGKGPKSLRGETRRYSLGHLLWEKTPLFALVAVSSIVTLLVQRNAGAVSTLQGLPLLVRASNAAVAYVRYLAKTVWPSDLAVFYPHPLKVPPLWQVAGSVLLLAGLSYVIVRSARSRPYLFVGWFWFLGTLVPVIGLVQVGSQSMADRYMYLPLVGLSVMLAWGFSGLLTPGIGPAVVAAATLLALTLATRAQLDCWRDSVSLFEHALKVTSHNHVAHYNLGIALAFRGQIKEATDHLAEAVRLKPDYAEAHNNLGIALATQGRADEAVGHFRSALHFKPAYADAHNNLGIALAGQGRIQEALAHFSEALRIDPEHVDAHYNLGLYLAREGRIGEAATHYSEALRIKPNYQKASLALQKVRASQKAERKD